MSDFLGNNVDGVVAELAYRRSRLISGYSRDSRAITPTERRFRRSRPRNGRRR